MTRNVHRRRQDAVQLPAFAGSVGYIVWNILASSAAAQEAPTRPTSAVATPVELEELVVVGSRIARKDAASVGPISTLTSDDITDAAPVSVGSLLQELPAAGVSLNSNGTQGTSYGVSSINLRYLGSAEGSGNRVLVLVDGHRWVNAAGGRGFRDFVDLNTIPLGIVDSVEVLKDGASAIYGADAIAGVVNIHTRKDLDGFEGGLTYGRTSRDDGRSTNAQLNFGHQFGRLSFLLSASYAKSNPIYTADRDLTDVADVPVTAPPTSPRGLFVLPGVSTAAAPITRIPGAAGTSTADFRKASLPADYYNTMTQGLDAEGPSKRTGLFGRIGYEITDGLSAYAEVLYNERDSDQLFSPVLLDVRGTYGISIPANQAYNPWARAFSGSSLRLQRVMDEVGDRDNVQNVKTKRYAAGLNGRFELGSVWDWDLFVANARNDATFDALNQVNYDNIALALGSTTRCSASSCIPLNIFGAITPQMADYIRYNGHETNGTEQTDAAFNITGHVLDLPAGKVGVAAGVEWRDESAYDRPDVYANSTPAYVTGIARTSMQTRDPTRGSYHLWEAYSELDVPLLANLPAVQSLDLSAAARYSDYSSTRSDTTTKLGLAWRPVSDLLLRGTYSEGFRAPSILELYQGERATTFQAVDPCNGGGAGLVGCAGVPSTYNQNQFGAGTIKGLTGGNPFLNPETAYTLSGGLAYTPSWAEGMSITSDWYRITIDGAIASQTPQQLLTNCAQRGGVYCQLIDRDPATGEVRNLRQAVLNFSKIRVEGIDLTWRYVLDTAFGKFEALTDVSRLLHFINYVPQPDGSVQVSELAGTGNTPRATYPKWKGNASLRWSDGPWSASWKARYIGTATDVAGNPVNGGQTDSVVYHDLRLGYQIERLHTDVTLGVDNVFDKMPPESYANSPINFDIYTYDVRGRYYFLRLLTKF